MHRPTRPIPEAFQAIALVQPRCRLAPLANQFDFALGPAILSGDAAGVSDLALGGGACG